MAIRPFCRRPSTMSRPPSHAERVLSTRNYNDSGRSSARIRTLGIGTQPSHPMAESGYLLGREPSCLHLRVPNPGQIRTRTRTGTGVWRVRYWLGYFFAEWYVCHLGPIVSRERRLCQRLAFRLTSRRRAKCQCNVINSNTDRQGVYSPRKGDSLKWHWDQGAVYILELAMDSDSGGIIPHSVSSQRRLAGWR
jgi:hypothetical protein